MSDSDKDGNGTALVPTPRVPLSFELQNMDEAYRFAQALGRSGLLPDSLRGKPDDILVVIIVGRELGMSPMKAVRSINVIKGKPVMSADLQVALCVRARDVCAYFHMIESSAEIATYETQRHGAEPSRMSFTWAEAKMAGLTGKGNWQSYPAAMLRARCSSALARAVYPDLVMGIYCEDEGDEIRRAAIPATIAPPPIPAPAPEAKMVEATMVKGEAVAPPQRDDGPIDTTTPERVPGEDDDGDPPPTVEDVMCRAVLAAKSKSELLALVPQIKLMLPEEQAHIRSIYGQRNRELS